LLIGPKCISEAVIKKTTGPAKYNSIRIGMLLRMWGSEKNNTGSTISNNIIFNKNAPDAIICSMVL
jgi:hypothetical protein